MELVTEFTSVRETDKHQEKKCENSNNTLTLILTIDHRVKHSFYYYRSSVIANLTPYARVQSIEQ